MAYFSRASGSSFGSGLAKAGPIQARISFPGGSWSTGIFSRSRGSARWRSAMSQNQIKLEARNHHHGSGLPWRGCQNKRKGSSGCDFSFIYHRKVCKRLSCMKCITATWLWIVESAHKQIEQVHRSTVAVLRAITPTSVVIQACWAGTPTPGATICKSNKLSQSSLGGEASLENP